MKQDLTPYYGRRTVLLEENDVVSSARLVSDEAPGLRDYWQLVRKHRWKILGCSVVAVFCATIFAFSMRPIYTASATLLIERKTPHVVNIQQVLSEGLESDELSYYQSQFEILRSRSVAAEVIKQQSLDTHPVFLGDGTQPNFLVTLASDAKKWISSSLTRLLQGERSVGSFQTQAPDASGVSSQLIDTYQQMLSVEPVKKSRLVQVKFSTPDPALSAAVANAHARAYIQQGQKLRSRANEDARKFLEAKLSELRQRVETSEDALNRFRREKGIISLDEKENIVVERLADLNKRLTDAEAERIGLEAQARLIKNRDYDSLPAVIGNPLIQSLKGQLVNLEGQYAQLAAQYKSGYPPVAKLQAQIDETKQKLAYQINSVVEGINSAYFAAVGKERELRAQMDKQKSAALALKDAGVEYAILAREANTNTELYNAVLGRMKEIGVSSEIPTSNVSILDSAEIPLLPSKPNKKMILMLGAVMGLMGGLGLALVSEHLDKTLRTPDDVQRYVGLPSLAIVPDFASLPKVRQRPPMLLTRHPSAVDSKLCMPAEKLVASGRPVSMITEAYRKLRTSILLSRPDDPIKTILVTSGAVGEGKTVTAVNTAIMFAQMGSPVLLIDADLRRPACHRALKMWNDRGLTDFLAGKEELGTVIKRTRVPNLCLLSSGTIPPNPTELLGSKKMRETLSSLKGRFEFIVVDSPPVVPVSDAVVLSNIVDGVVFVVRGQQTQQQLVKAAVGQLEDGQAKILGVVLNRVDIGSAEYVDYYRYYYPGQYAYEPKMKSV
ncbi:MAG TPA: polysaccharide biosynthesis tyrosine autokinase [Candidatus Eisenbacteria bacterium]|nr:polysaccharide biosynthesis tyrosine autokinase [Candidatus Eisenbacteria bacterium]